MVIAKPFDCLCYSSFLRRRHLRTSIHSGLWSYKQGFFTDSRHFGCLLGLMVDWRLSAKCDPWLVTPNSEFPNCFQRRAPLPPLPVKTSKLATRAFDATGPGA